MFSENFYVQILCDLLFTKRAAISFDFVFFSAKLLFLARS